jgi:hypothetical protein
MRSALGRSPLAGDRRDGLGLSVARKRAPTGPSAAMSSLPTAPSSSIERRADQNPCARPWVGARLRATVAMASGSPSPASGLLPVPARQCHLCRQPQAHRAKDVHTNPCARPWVGARLRATVAMASDTPSPASGLLPVPARQCHLCRRPQAHRSKDVHTNPCARPWVGARLRATVAMASGSPSPASGLLPIPARQCHLCRRPQAHRSKDVHINPYARPWVGARLRATVAMASGSPSPASGLLPVPARQCHLCRQPQAHRSKDVHTNPCARPWVGARLRATVAMASGSPSPASGLLPVPARQCHLCRRPQAHRAKDVQTKTHALGSGQEPACGRPSRWPRALRRPQAGSYRSRRGNVISADSPKLIDRKMCTPTHALGPG